MPENPKFQSVPHQIAHFHQDDWCLDTDPDLLEFVISVTASFDIPSPFKAFLKPSMPLTVVGCLPTKGDIIG